VSLCWT